LLSTNATLQEVSSVHVSFIRMTKLLFLIRPIVWSVLNVMLIWVCSLQTTHKVS